MACLIGVIYCFLWYSSILAGYAGLFCPLLPLVFISNKWYRYCTDVLFTFWQMYPTVLLELLCGCEIEATGDAIYSEETSILVMNHRTRTDWNFLWPAIYHSTVGINRFKYPTKFILKDIIRHIPGPGWVMQLACFLYIKRCWIADKPKLRSLVDYFCSMSYKFSLLLFPEGTDLTTTTKGISNKFAEKHGLKKYDYVLHPRTTGFSFLTGRLLNKHALDSLYDITLAYCDRIPQSEKDMLWGNFPRKIKMHFTRYPSTVLPHSEDNLKKFLEKCWSEKEEVLKEFHVNGNFPTGHRLIKSNRVELYLALVFWTSLPAINSCCNMEEKHEIDLLPDRVYENFINATFFLTGATGFVGKVLLERLLRVFDVKKVYLLIRCKGDTAPQDRLQTVFAGPLFDKVRNLKGQEIFKKCVIIPGDIVKDGLDLSKEDLQVLQDEVEYVVHSAATVRFDEPLRKAFLINTKGTYSMIELAKTMKKLKIFTYISTTFCHPEEKILYEKLYKNKYSVKFILTLIDACDEETVEAMGRKFLEEVPNSYTISKALAEDVVAEAMDTVPAIIVRPSVVVPIWKEPLPGWSDNTNGPTGLLIAGGKGVLRSMYGNREAYADFISADVVADCIMVIKAYSMHNQMPHRVYNVSAYNEFKISWGEIIDLGTEIATTKIPFDLVLWAPGGTLINSKFVHYLVVILGQFLPALIVDALVPLAGHKPFLWKIQMRIVAGSKVLEYYTSTNWAFDNQCVMNARRWMNSYELPKYTVSADGLNVREYFVNAAMGARRYIMKEPDENIPKSLRMMRIMVLVDRIYKTFFKLLLAYFFYKWILLRIYSYFSNCC
ncbi:Male sterility protein [Popillia japonica]|uniref:Fatty acyl-CoA reductase n=1 Tax=Popillia japonica TaxID=7064 RepID=A0AAW1LWW0_POPJA